MNRNIVELILSSLPHVELVVAVDGKQALEAAMDCRFDLMIFDRNMPFINGDRVIRQLKAGRTVNATTPVIEFTAEADDRTSSASGKGLADALLSKPIHAKVLLETVTRFLGD